MGVGKVSVGFAFYEVFWQLGLITSGSRLGIHVPEAAQGGQRCPATLLGQLQYAKHSQLSSAAGRVADAGLHVGHNPPEELSPFIFISD